MLIIGFSGMLARILTREDNSTYVGSVKHLVAAVLSTFIAWCTLNDYEMENHFKVIIYAFIGISAPEIMNGIIKIAKKFSANPFEIVSKIIIKLLSKDK